MWIDSGWNGSGIYIVELWCLVIYCDKMLKDRFVCGFK